LIENSIFKSIRAKEGGGIKVSDSYLSINNSLFNDIYAYEGGGIFLLNMTN